MVDKRHGAGTDIDELRIVHGPNVDEHIAIVGPRYSGKTFLAKALAVAFHDNRRGNSVEIRGPGGRNGRTHTLHGGEQHLIVIYDGWIPEPPPPGLRVISVSGLG